MSNAAKVRAYPEQHGPSEAATVRLALGLTYAQCHAALGEMGRSGFVLSSGPIRARIYTRTAKVNWRDCPQTPEQLREKNLARLEAKRRLDGRLTWAEYNAKRQAERDARLADKSPGKAIDRAQAALARMKRRQEYDRKRLARQKAERHAARAANPKTTKATYRKTQNVPLIRVTTPTTVQVAKRDVSADVARWLAEGGQIIHEPIGKVSLISQLKHIDNRGMAA